MSWRLNLKTGLTVVTLSLSLWHSQAMARAYPSPEQTPAPGNEQPQTPLHQANYQDAVNYQLQCLGCHLGNGEGSVRNDTPRMTDFVGNFLRVEGGREFLIRVPGVAQAALNNDQLASLLNWILTDSGMAGNSTPRDFMPYTGDEIAQVRHKSYVNLPGVRSDLIARMKQQGIAITDGMPN